MKSMWIALGIEALAVGLVVGREAIGTAERDVARRVLVEQRVEEDRFRRADPALAVDEERDLADAGGALVEGRPSP